jgi:hypothetical protein
MTRPLEGIRVLDLSQGAAGPWCAMLLGDLGAEIAKVEPPSGDWGRTLGPPFVDGVATCFLAMNRNKRGAVIDLKKPGGSSIVTRMAALADVVVENFRHGRQGIPVVRGGQWRDVAGGKLFDDFEPYTGNLYARVPNCGAEEARVAIAAAHEAFGPWAETPPAEKAHLDQRHQR